VTRPLTALVLATAAAAVCAGPVASARQDPQGAVFRAGAQTVAVYATVSDASGRLVSNLTRDDFQITDNGAPVALTVFSNDIQPITVSILLDMSTSMGSRFARLRDATRHFVDTLLPDDRASIGTFGWEVAISPLLTHDKQVLDRVLEEELWPGGSTPLWTAIDQGMTSLSAEHGRRVVVVITDGDDECYPQTMTCAKFPDVEKHAVNDGMMVYAIGLEGGGLDPRMAALAEESGGGHFQIAPDADLTQTFARVADELHHQYVLGFTPASLDGKTHQLSVRVTKPGLTAKGRKTYVAKGDK
jgi:Ca-activated chloride channel family protein